VKVRNGVRKTIVALLALVATASALAIGSPRPAGADGTLETGRALPVLPASTQPSRVALDGSWVYVALQSSAPETTPSGIYRTAADGSGTWTAVTNPDTGSIVTTQSSLVVRDGYLLVQATAQDAGTPCPDYQLVGPVHARNLSSCGLTTLVDGGRLERTETWTGPWQLETLSGTPLRSFDHYTVVSGNRGWYLDDTQRLASRDVTTGDFLPLEPLPPSCQPYIVTGAAAGYVEVECFNETAVLDVDGGLPPWPLGTGSWGLGSAFAAGSSGNGDLAIQDLGQGKATRHFAVSTPARWSPDAGGGPQAAFLTPDLQVAMADLGTLAPRNTTAEDVTPPGAFLYAGQTSVVRPDQGSTTAHLTYSWNGGDPDHLLAISYDTEQAYGPVGQTRTWGPGRSDTTITSQTQDIESGYEYCIRVRARDWAGNLSPWTSAACTLVDGQRPTVRWTMTNWEGIHPALGNHPVLLSWKGTDFGGLTHSVLSQRVALPGYSAGAWTTPVKWQWLTKTKVWGWYYPGETVCFRVRMQDRAGNLSSALETGTRCTSIPYDDRNFTISGTTLRATSEAKLGGTYTRLRDGRSWMQHKSLRMRAVDIRISPNSDNIPRIYLGNYPLDRAVTIFYDGTGIWVRYPMFRTIDGTLRIRGTDFGEIRVDAIAIEH